MMKKLLHPLLIVLMMILVSFATGTQYLRGDVDQSNTVNISDVTCLIDYLLTSDATGISTVNADCNLDGEVNIGDITCLIDYLLTSEWPAVEPATETFTVNGVTFTMVAVKGGTFTMGATAEQGSDATDDEYPAHQVTVSSYSIGQTEVTQALWLAVMGDNPSECTSANGYTDNLNRPVEQVSWNDCHTFITKLNQLTGKTFRLPTEAEWEFAARGGNKSHGYKYAGSNTIEDVAWFWGDLPSHTHGTAGFGTQPVATKAPNELGLYDMSGNVYEWCQDWFGSYSSDAQTNPTGPSSGTYRVDRGGGWHYDAGDSRVSFRDYSGMDYGWASSGLRLAL